MVVVCLMTGQSRPSVTIAVERCKSASVCVVLSSGFEISCSKKSKS